MKETYSRVSVKGQTVVPRKIRQALGIGSGTILQWEAHNGVIVVRPLPRDAVGAAAGSLQGRGLSIADFLKYRQQEREREQAEP